MKKTLLFAAATAALHGGVLAQTPAPSVVSIYGIVDLALRHTTNDGATAATRGDSQSQVTAGMSQSQIIHIGRRFQSNLNNPLLLPIVIP